MRLISLTYVVILLISCHNDEPPLGVGISFYSVDSECSGRNYVFSSYVSNSSVKYLWEFGDGDIDSIPSPLKIYKKAGTYEVTLTISSGTRTTRSIPTVLHVDRDGDLPGPKTAFARKAMLSTLEITFENKTENGTSFVWEFGDGTTTTTATTQDVVHVYQSTGSYTVTLRSTNNEGTTCSTKIINVF